MQSTLTEIAPDIYRISTFHPDFGIQFNQFVVKDDEPFLMYTGLKKMFAATLEAVACLLDPAKLRWTFFARREAIVQNRAGRLANDVPYTPYTDATLLRLAALKPRTLGVMHGSAFQGDGEAAILRLAEVIRETLGERKSS